MTSSPELPYAHRGPSLNARQEAFCDFYDEGGNAAAAARRACYSGHSARRQGARLMADDNIQQHIATLKKIRARARALDHELLLERLEELYHATMAEGRLNAAIQALRLMAQIGGHTSRAAQEEYAESELDDGRPFGPLQRAARQVAPRPAAARPEEGELEAETLLHEARLTLARTRPDSQLGKTPLRARLFMGTPAARAGTGNGTGKADMMAPPGVAPGAPDCSGQKGVHAVPAGDAVAHPR